MSDLKNQNLICYSSHQIRLSIPAVEAALAARAHRWSSVLLASPSDDVSSVSGRRPAGPAPAASGGAPVPLSESLPRAVFLRKASLRANRQAIQMELVKLLHTVVTLVSVYNQMDKEMIQFVGQEIVQHQANLDQVND